MNEVDVVIEWKSCKSSGVDTDRYKGAIENQLKEIGYLAKVNISDDAIGAYYLSGIKRIGGVDLATEEITRIQDTLAVIFRNLSEEPRKTRE
ncbi:hypothetical protein V6R97_06690 [Chromohalobacter salexigens]|uniref:hypothetical protein n=1 Tax=Chromohalobacter israelensis TaxID=141390 RepID=UPI0032E90DAB